MLNFVKDNESPSKEVEPESTCKTAPAEHPPEAEQFSEISTGIHKITEKIIIELNPYF